jgi:hypothetical protein
MPEQTVPENQPAPQPAAVPEVNIQNDEDWKEPPIVSFEQQASLQIARWVLYIFAGGYALCFVMGFFMMRYSDAKYEGSLEFVKFMISSILPLVTLAVGYYLGDKSRNT